MLVLRYIEMEGFGPYAARERLDLPQQGVIAVYGDNMRGKTSLLNAVRYALFGRVVGTGSTARRLTTVSNRELATQGKYRFTVTLGFSADDVAYELTRQCRLREGVQVPQDDSDYRSEVVLRRGSEEVLGPQQRDKILAEILPEEVSRFFLFDGELLTEYEELVREHASDAGRKISEAIERILGVPILKRARVHVRQLREEADREAAQEASRSSETQALGVSIEQTSAQLEAHREQQAKAREDLRGLQEQRAEAEAFLEANARAAAIMNEREQKKQRREDVRRELGTAEQDLKDLMGQAWRTVLSRRVREVRSSLQRDVEAGVASVAHSLRERAIEDAQCQVCDTMLDEATVNELRSTLQEKAPTPDLLGTLRRTAALGEFVDGDVGAHARELDQRLRELRIERTHLATEISELQTALEDVDQERVGATETSLGEVMKKIYEMERAVEEEGIEIKGLEEDISAMMARLERRGTIDLARANARAGAYRHLETVLGGAIERYKNDLRQQVEATASALFLKMTTEKSDFTGLQINDGYGLEIVHQDGRIEEGRSAGAEHVVALALIGALQRHAPMRGPILMDSTFHRLDPRHTANVVQSLTSMASQVVLLVQEKELARQEVRRLLEGDLVAEYELVYQSARRTQIRPVS